jgi:sortase A
MHHFHGQNLSVRIRPAIISILLFVLVVTGCAGAIDSDSAPPPNAVALSAEPTSLDGDVSAAETAPDRLQIPAIDADMPVVKLGWHKATNNENAIFSEWDVAEYAAGWHKNSALPGETGNVVLSGHNNILGSVFRELDQLRAGDDTYIWFDGERFDYVVEQVIVVPEKYASEEQRRENAKWIGEFSDERLTLVSCWPRNNNTHRIIVVARPADRASATDQVDTSARTTVP